MTSSNSTYVTVEQLGAWVECREWRDQGDATRIGFSERTLAEIIDRHLSGCIHLSAIVDGTRCLLQPEAVGDFIFDSIWLIRAGLYQFGTRGNLEIRGRSIQVFLPEKLVDLSCPSDQLVPSPNNPAGERGYHRVMRNIWVSRKEATEVWPSKPQPKPSNSPLTMWRNEIMDLLLVDVACPTFKNGAAALFTTVRMAILPLSSFADAEIEQLVSTEWPRFWSWQASVEWRPQRSAIGLRPKRIRGGRVYARAGWPGPVQMGAHRGQTPD
jgi:hypothetical protein